MGRDVVIPTTGGDRGDAGRFDVLLGSLQTLQSGLKVVLNQSTKSGTKWQRRREKEQPLTFPPSGSLGLITVPADFSPSARLTLPRVQHDTPLLPREASEEAGLCPWSPTLSLESLQ